MLNLASLLTAHCVSELFMDGAHHRAIDSFDWNMP
jgi:hypothetical protein